MSNLEALRDLIERVSPGWLVDTTNHDYINDSGTSIVTANTGTILRGEGTGGAKRSWYMSWPLPGEDFEMDGNTLRIYTPYHAYTGGRAIVLMMKFNPPAES